MFGPVHPAGSAAPNAVIGAERFRVVSSGALAARGALPGQQHDFSRLAVREPQAREPPHTPQPRSTGRQFRGDATGDRPSPPVSAPIDEVSSGCGLLALSLRLSAARLQQRLSSAGDAWVPSFGQTVSADHGHHRVDEPHIDQPQAMGMMDRSRAFGEALKRTSAQSTRALPHAGPHPLPVPAGEPEPTVQPGLGLFARSHALNEALGKKAKTGGLFGDAFVAHAAQAVRVGEVGEEGRGLDSGFQRGRLTEWAQLAVEHAPKARPGKDKRAVPGGLQDAYIHAVRRYLTETSLACQGANTPVVPGQEAVTPGHEPSEAVVLACPSRRACLLLRVADAHDAFEGVIVPAELLEGSVSQHVGVGCRVRLLLHRRHPLMQQNGEWVPRAGNRLKVRGFQVVAQGAAGRGPLLLPVEVAAAGSDEQPCTPEVRGRGAPRPAWECLYDI